MFEVMYLIIIDPNNVKLLIHNDIYYVFSPRCFHLAMIGDYEIIFVNTRDGI